MRINSISNTMPMAVRNKQQNNSYKNSLANQTNSQNPNFGMKFLMTPEVQNDFTDFINRVNPGEMTKFVTNLRNLVNNLEPIYKGFTAICDMNRDKSSEYGDYIIKIEFDNGNELNNDMNEILGGINEYIPGYCHNNTFTLSNLSDLVVYQCWNMGMDTEMPLSELIHFCAFYATRNALDSNAKKILEGKFEKSQIEATINLLEKMNIPDLHKNFSERINQMNQAYDRRQKIINDSNKEQENMGCLASITTK